jgi:hypothetical protein
MWRPPNTTAPAEIWSSYGATGAQKGANVPRPLPAKTAKTSQKTVANRCAYLRFGPHGKERQRPRLAQQRWVVVAKDERTHGKWCGTIEIEGPQRVGYLSVWSSGEMDCQVLRGADIYVLNEHRLVRSAEELEQALATFLEVVGYTDPREPLML